MTPSIILNDFSLEDFFSLDTESQQSVFNFSQMQVAKSSTIPSETDVTDLCCILYNKPHIIATFFFQQKTAFELFYHITSDFFFKENKGKKVPEIRLKIAKNKWIAARLIWQLVIHSRVILHT